jgi:hypothetical protein
MYLARFCYDVLPVNRQRAIEFIHREVEAARANRLNARMLVPLTRGHGVKSRPAIRGRADEPRSARSIPQSRRRLVARDRRLDARLQ